MDLAVVVAGEPLEDECVHRHWCMLTDTCQVYLIVYGIPASMPWAKILCSKVYTYISVQEGSAEVEGLYSCQAGILTSTLSMSEHAHSLLNHVIADLERIMFPSNAWNEAACVYRAQQYERCQLVAQLAEFVAAKCLPCQGMSG